MFPDDRAAERWFVTWRWPEGVECPRCDSKDIQERQTRKPQPYRCRSCRKDFSVKTDTLMHNSKLGLQPDPLHRSPPEHGLTHLARRRAHGVRFERFEREAPQIGRLAEDHIDASRSCTAVGPELSFAGASTSNACSLALQPSA